MSNKKRNKNRLKVKHVLYGGGKIALIFLIVLLTAGIGKKLYDYVATVTFNTADPEASNWEVTRNGGIVTAKYSGNRRVKDVYAIPLTDLGTIVDGKKVLWATQDLFAKTPWTTGRTFAWSNSSNDVATQNLGSDYSVPTQAEWEALKNSCHWAWTTTYKGHVLRFFLSVLSNTKTNTFQLNLLH